MRPAKFVHALTLLGLAAPLLAQAPGQTAPMPIVGLPPMAPPPKAPRFDDALVVARAALVACRAQGSHVTVLVVGANNMPIVLFADDKSDGIAQQLAPRKTELAIKYKAPSAETAEKAKGDAALLKEIRADPRIGFALPGGLPIMAGGELIGAIAVSGGASPEQDAACAAAGLAKVKIRPL